MKLAASLIAGVAISTAVFAAKPPAKHRNFVACPIVRDTASVPCWLAEHEGELYYLTIQTDVSAPVNPPWLGHKVLVEGVVSDEPRICGGIVLKPVALSVMQALDGSCNQVLPAEDRYNLNFEPPRPPGPSKGRLAFGDPAPKAAATPADRPRTFELKYDFDSMVVFRHAQPLEQILEFARQSKASQIEITGYRAASLLSSGEAMMEHEAVGRRRAEQVAELLRGAGLTNVDFQIRWQDESKKANGVDDASRRRAVVVVR